MDSRDHHKYPSPPDDTQPQRDQVGGHPRDGRRPEEYSTGEANGRRPAPPALNLPPMASNVTLPGIHGLYPSYPPPPGQSPSTGPVHPPLPDPRNSNYAASPTSANGYPPVPPPPLPPQGHPPHGYPPPPPHVHPGHYPPPPQHPGHPLPHHIPPPQPGQHAPPPPSPYADYYAQRGPYPPPPPNYGYYPPPPGYPYGAEYGMPQQQPQIAPRQRTSIACRYCRKRKIRCSGYANMPNGKCSNCDKLRIDCVFQPVSSGSSTAFIPVSAVPGGVPPGTPVYGAYGQPLGPLAPSAGAPHSNQGGSYPSHAGNGHPGNYPSQQPPQPSPTTSQYAGQGDNRSDMSDMSQSSRRRPREDDDEDPGQRLPPPNPYGNGYDPRRRSPASNDASNDGTPPMYHYQHTTRSFEAERTPPPRRGSGGYSPSNTNGRPTSAIYGDTPGQAGGAPPQQYPYPNGQPDRGASYPPPPPANKGGRPSPRGDPMPSPGIKREAASNTNPNSAPQPHSVMSLNNLLGHATPKGNDIDDSMIGKLNKRH